jgi:hypothetical protein
MKCPKCTKDAKNSTTYPGVFVCGCLGYLEDVSLLSSNMTGRLKIEKLHSADEVLQAGQDLNNGLLTRYEAEDYVNEGSFYKVSKSGTTVYTLWILSEDKLIPDAHYFRTRNGAEPVESDRINFKEITRFLVDSGVLNRMIFEDRDEEFAQFYLS